jgi:hypothetical protein
VSENFLGEEFPINSPYKGENPGKFKASGQIFTREGG